MNAISASPSMTSSNSISRILPTPSPIPSSSSTEPEVTTPKIRQQSSATLGHYDIINNNTTATTTTIPVEDQQQQSQQEQPQPQQKQRTAATHSEMESPVLDSTDLPSDTSQVASISCKNCGTTTTPLWRRAPNGDTICNACGLYLKAKHTYRPTSMKRNIQPKKRQQQQQQTDTATGATTTTSGCAGHGTSDSISGSCPGGGKCNGTGGSSSCAGCPTFNNQRLRRQQEQQLDGLVCANCATTTTPLWRRDDQGNTICNACGLYYKLHSVHRPVSMKRSVIKRRKRLIVMGAGGDDQNDGDDDDELMKDENIENQRHCMKYDQQQQQQSPTPPKKIRKPYRKRVKALDEGPDQQAKGKRNKRDTIVDQRHSSPSITAKSALSVPAIEDYIVPKRTGLPVTAEVLPSSSSSSHTTITPPLNGLHRQPSYHSHQFYHHPPSHLPSTRMDNPSSSSLSLPPISSERRSAHFDPFYRDGSRTGSPPSSSSPSSTVNASLPPMSLPPLLRPTATTPSTTATINNNNDTSTPLHHLNTTSQGTPFPPSPNSTGSSSAFTTTRPLSENELQRDFLRQQQQQQNPAFMELEDWDEALKNLQMLRKKVQPEHVSSLAQLSKPLWDMVSKAQSIVHGTGALSHP